MDFSEYQDKARRTAIYPVVYLDDGRRPTTLCACGWIYPAMGLAGESGEVNEKLKKVLRDQNGIVTPETKELLRKELGDVLWYVGNLAYELGLDLNDIAESNIAKLQSRKERDVIKGSGDER